MKKIISLFLSLTMLLSLTAGLDFSAYADTLTTGKCGKNVTYSFDSNTGTLTISGTGDMYDYSSFDADALVFYNNINIKVVIVEKGVTSIGYPSFYGCTSLVSVTIPDSVTSIGASAFCGCTSLTSITIPDSVTSIDDYAFSRCTSLANITIPNTVKSIGDSAFYNCYFTLNNIVNNSACDITGATIVDTDADGFCVKDNTLVKMRPNYAIGEISIPSSVTSIGSSAFSSCTSLTSVTIPDNVTSIGSSAFSSCTSLANITIPNTVKSIGNSAFYNCYFTLNNIVNNSACDITGATIVDTDADGFCVKDNTLVKMRPNYAIGEISIPSSVTSIGSSAFSSCTSLENVTIPDGVTSIGDRAFFNCKSLTSINVEKNNINYSSFNGVLFNKNKKELICYPAGKNDKIYEIPDGVTSIGSEAFAYCANLTNVTISDSVTSIDEGAFEDCKNLTSILIPDSVKNVGDGAFADCRKLSELNMSNGVESIGAAAFQSCISLEHVMIPDSVINIGIAAFSVCTNLNSINVDNMNSIYCSKDGVLFNKNMTELIVCPAGKSAELYEVPNSVVHIDDYAFYSCRNLSNIIVSGSVESIGDYAFTDCTDLLSITILNEQCEISDRMIEKCAKILGFPNSTAEKYSKTYGNEFSTIHCDDYGINHDYYRKLIKKPTCTDKGVTEYTCSRCQYTFSEENVDALGHKYTVKTLVKPTCVSGGKNEYICDRCSYKYTEETPALGGEHLYTSHIIIQPTCTNNGIIEYECSRCGETYDEKIDALGHNYESRVLTQPTCTAKGVTRYTCSRCGDSYDEENIDALGHEYVSKIVTQPTCTTKGATKYTCSRCGDSYSKIDLAALGHNYVSKIVTQPTCTAKGVTRYTCSRCSDSYDKENIESLGHNYEAKVVTQPTCTAKGITRYTCSRCGDSYDKDDIAALGHEYVSKVVTQPTCTAKGVTRYTCTRCGDSYDKDDIAALGHSYTEKITKNPTCEKEGTKQYTCSRCSYSYTASVQALGHDLKLTESVKPTILSDGYDLYECQRSGCDYFEETDYPQLTLDYNKKICSNGTDTYKVEMAKSGYLVFDFAGESESWNINIYDEDHKKVDALTPQYKEFYKKSYLQMGAGETVPNKNQIVTLFAGTYYVEIERLNASTNDNFSGYYEFSIDYTPSAETIKETKSNFYYDAPTAKNINLNKTYNGFLGAKYAAVTYSGKDLITTDERDAYKFEIPKGSGWSQFSLTLTSKTFGPFDSDCTVTVYNSEFEPCAEFTPLSVNSNKTNNEIAYLYEGVYYIAVENRNPNSVSSKQAPIEYSFTTSFKPSGTFTCITHRSKLTETKNPTCTKDGYKLYTCQICNAQYKEIIKAKGHTIVTDKGVPATCTGSGLTSGTHCSTCGAIVTAQQIISAKGHTYKQTVTPATTSKDGKIVKKCSVCSATVTSSIAKISSVSLSAVNTYNGGVKTPSVTVKDSKGKKLSNGKDYTVSYSSGRKNVGRYAVKIKLKGNYSGTVTKTFDIVPKGTSIKKISASKKGFKVYWKAQKKNTTGYEIQYSTAKSFKNAKTVKVSKNSATSQSVAKLSGKKKYFVRVRTYKTVKYNGKKCKVHSSWSKPKTVVTKK